MNTLKRLILSLTFFSLIISPGKAQNTCGTVISNAQYQNELNWINHKPTINTPAMINQTLEITAYITGGDSLYVNIINKALDSVNIYFAPIGLSFKLCEYYLIKDHTYDTISNSVLENEVRIKFNTPNTINIYFVNDLSANGSDVCGYTYMPLDNRNYMLLKRACTIGFSITHELGHFFGLYHTSETKFGNELVNESNCKTAGDLMCSTPADPGLSASNVSADCSYTGSLVDANNQYYIPSVSDFMSLASFLGCGCYFTNEQYAKMKLNYYLFKTNLR